MGTLTVSPRGYNLGPLSFLGEPDVRGTLVRGNPG